MKTEDEEFAGWLLDTQGQNRLWTRRLVPVARAGTIVCCGLVLGLWLMSRVTHRDMIPFLGILVCLGVLAELFVTVATRKDASFQGRCSVCGRIMTVVETLPNPTNYKAGDLIVGESGHCYKLLPSIYGVALAVEVRMQWRACEVCKRYFSTVPELRVKIGNGRDAIRDQEDSFRSSARAIARSKSPQRKAMGKRTQPKAT